MPSKLVFIPIVALVLTACYDGGAPLGGAEDSDGSSTTGSTTTLPPAQTSSSGGSPADTTASTTDEPELDSSGSSTGEPPAEPEPGVHWVGRYDDTEPGAMRMGWSGAGFVVRFDGTGVSVDMDDSAYHYTVVLDGVVQPRFDTTPGRQVFALVADLPPGEHTVEVYRRTEGNFGPTTVYDVVPDGELLAPPPVTRRMEVVGDSISAGYGNEGEYPCTFSSQTENHYLTYGAVAARAVEAEVHTVAWSGKGVIYNYGDGVDEPLPEIYDRIVATEGASWSFGWQPDVVVINLGTNDFSTDNDPSQELFTSSYVAFLEHLRSVYPNAFLLAVAPSLFGAEVPVVEGYMLDVVAQRQAAGDANVAYADINVEWNGMGCDWHPNVVTHAGMADRLVQELQVHLGW
ncbi:MAG: SGNH/GDSL hydrolase family protein [Myxococcota bacterium]